MTLGPTEFINKAKRLRKALGGGMRQSGILAAAGLIALDDFESGMLLHDHKRAQQLADAIKGIYIKILINIIHTTTTIPTHYYHY